MEQTNWDAALVELGGSILQSWRWGEYRRGQGWEVERLRIDRPEGVAMAQVLFKHVGPVSVATVPRGPVLVGNTRAVFGDLMAAVDACCRRHRTVSLVVEPNEALPLTGTYRSAGFVRGPGHYQPSRTVKVRLQDDEALLASIHRSTRLNIRRARRDGVTVERAADDDASLATLYRLIEDTSRRNGFFVNPNDYYFDFFRAFRSDAALLFARAGDTVVAALLAVRFGQETIYMHGGSSTADRTRGVAHLLQFDTMRWARDEGCTWYDLWGTPTPGLYQFKVGFGGEVVDYPPTLERRYHKALSWLSRRAFTVLVRSRRARAPAMSRDRPSLMLQDPALDRGR